MCVYICIYVYIYISISNSYVTHHQRVWGHGFP